MSQPYGKVSALYRSERIHLMDVSRALDNGTASSRKEEDNKLWESEPRHYCYSDSSRVADFSNESDMSEAIYRPVVESDTSASLALSTAATQGFCYECVRDKRRRRKMVSRSVMLDNYTKIDPNSDSGVLLRHCPGDSDSSSSGCSAAPVRFLVGNLRLTDEACIAVWDLVISRP
ncbi:uncharacterized protein CEXT_487001 [Caerostris extrusa]|uniref:Uncharacterized protein n=1 Tax=Caerostris extrusa TaxID=172846 RepID=A0AAV4QR72_CAEEX|nr:uncharacterized protein CEXT_487001 [Caerostris extrusa]